VQTKIHTLVYVIIVIFLSGCTGKQISQTVYDSVKSNECMKTQGTAICNPEIEQF
jgi:hypothetical protein